MILAVMSPALQGSRPVDLRRRDGAAALSAALEQTFTRDAA
ncbi:hypothetical protein ACFRJ9_21495 [Paenarthrobacter sp. NPDC056912]